MRKLSFVIVEGTCLLCESPSHRHVDLCAACERDLPTMSIRCERCSLPLLTAGPCAACVVSPPPFDATFCLFSYRTPVDRMITDFKEHRRMLYGFVLSQLTATARAAARQPLPDILVPVPLHRAKLRQRGFNQAEEIARVIGTFLCIPSDTRAVRRRRSGDDQKTLNRNQRLRNLRGAFAICRRFEGKTVAIVDDVVTTGATVSELARVLRLSGASRVEVIALARTPDRPG